MWEGAPLDPIALLAPASCVLPPPHSVLLGTVPLCPPQRPSPLTAGHHPAHEVPGVGAAVPQRASGPGELQKVSGALGCMMAAVSPSLSRGVLPAPWSLGTSHFGAGCSVQWDEPGFAIPQGPNPPKTTTCPLTAFLPHALSLLTLLWHHTLAVLSTAAGQQVSSAQRYKKLHCALKVPWRGTGVVPSKDGVFGYQLTASFSPEPGAVLPCRGLWAAAGDPPHRSLPGTACWGYPQGVLALRGGHPWAVDLSVCLSVSSCPSHSHWRRTWPSAPPPAANSSRNTSATGSSSRWESG